MHVMAILDESVCQLQRSFGWRALRCVTASSPELAFARCRGIRRESPGPVTSVDASFIDRRTLLRPLRRVDSWCRSRRYGASAQPRNLSWGSLEFSGTSRILGFW